MVICDIMYSLRVFIIIEVRDMSIYLINIYDDDDSNDDCDDDN